MTRQREFDRTVAHDLWDGASRHSAGKAGMSRISGRIEYRRPVAMPRRRRPYSVQCQRKSSSSWTPRGQGTRSSYGRNPLPKYRRKPSPDRDPWPRFNARRRNAAATTPPMRRMGRTFAAARTTPTSAAASTAGAAKCDPATSAEFALPSGTGPASSRGSVALRRARGRLATTRELNATPSRRRASAGNDPAGSL